MISSQSEGVEEIAKKFEYGDDEYILSGDIGAYIFNYKNKSSRQTEVKPIKIDESGFEVETLDRTIDELNSISDELFYTIKYGKATD
jgi:hypothetical protein